MLSFSRDNLLLVAKALEGTIYIWNTATWETVITMEGFVSGAQHSSLAFHPHTSALAISDVNKAIIYDMDMDILLANAPSLSSVHYTNAKVVLVGDSGVGKSGLSLVLTKQPFIATESTHSRHVRTLEIQEVEHSDGSKETRELLLWDLAGQPGYRLTHLLHLSEVAVALVVFDSRNEIDPFKGVDHWIRALRRIEKNQENIAIPMKKFLIAARIDR